MTSEDTPYLLDLEEPLDTEAEEPVMRRFWLFSYRGRSTHWFRDRTDFNDVRRTTAVENKIDLLDVHPAIWIEKQRRAERELLGMIVDDKARLPDNVISATTTIVEIIYSITEIPPGRLTASQVIGLVL